MTNSELIRQLDLKICWECAETKPVFAHNTCQNLDRITKELEELLDTEVI